MKDRAYFDELDRDYAAWGEEIAEGETKVPFDVWRERIKRGEDPNLEPEPCSK